MMTNTMITYKFSNAEMNAAVQVDEDGCLTELGNYAVKIDGSVADWVMTCSAQSTGTFKLSYEPGVEHTRSTVVWVPSKNHYMEVRRGSQTKFSSNERRYWLSLEEWLVSLIHPGDVVEKKQFAKDLNILLSWSGYGYKIATQNQTQMLPPGVTEKRRSPRLRAK